VSGHRLCLVLAWQGELPIFSPLLHHNTIAPKNYSDTKERIKYATNALVKDFGDGSNKAAPKIKDQSLSGYVTISDIPEVHPLWSSLLLPRELGSCRFYFADHDSLLSHEGESSNK